MRIGQDRHEIGAQVMEIVFPANSPHMFGQPLGGPITQLSPPWNEARHGNTATITLDDPNGNERVISVEFRALGGTLDSASLRFRSRDKMDIDAAYRPIKTHLDAAYGAPRREVGNVLVFRWSVPRGGLSLSRYRDGEGFAVLLLQLAENS